MFSDTTIPLIQKTMKLCVAKLQAKQESRMTLNSPQIFQLYFLY